MYWPATISSDSRTQVLPLQNSKCEFVMRSSPLFSELQLAAVSWTRTFCNDDEMF